MLVDEPAHGEFFGFASMLEETPHQTNATAIEETTCLEVFDRDDIAELLRRKPLGGHADADGAGQAVSFVATVGENSRHAECGTKYIEEKETFGERMADKRGVNQQESWDVHHHFRGRGAADVFDDQHFAVGTGVGYDPFILLNLFLSMLAAMQAPVIMMSQNRQERKTGCGASGL